MKKTLFGGFGVALGALVLSGTVAAHHGDAGRYIEDVVTIQGSVVELQFINPHSIVVFDVSDATGKKVRWQGELGGPQQLMKQFGWTMTTLKPGDKITLIGRRAKSGAPYMNLTERANVVLTDTGKEIFRTANFGEAAPETPAGAKPY